MNIAASVKKLRLKFPGDESLLFRDLSVSVHKGEKVLFLGPSGCGKSTLLQVLTGIIPDSVEVPLQYERIDIPPSWGYVFQDPDTQFCMPFVDEEIAFVLENLQVPRRRMAPLIEKYLNMVGLHFNDMHMKIQSLSQGMKQRLAIASVLALEPDVLFLDEPTALLDPEGTEQIWRTIKTAGSGKTLIIVEHKIDHIADFVDRVVLFDDAGGIIADGSPQAVFRSCKQQLIEYGIWYPGVWDDYASSPAYRQLRQERGLPHGGGQPHERADARSDAREGGREGVPLIFMEHFQGCRGKQPKINVPRAEVFAGEWIAVVGENGAGKTTLLLALMQLIQTSGDYRIKGIPAAGAKRLPQQLALVFQNPEFQFVTNSVYDEMAYTLRLEKRDRKEADEKVNELLSFFELEHKRNHHPYQLSMGQKRRLSVASAVVIERDVLLLDEPTFGQDAKNTFAMLEKIEQWRRRGTTIMMVTHDLQIVKHFATRVWEISGGKLVRDWPPDQ